MKIMTKADAVNIETTISSLCMMADTLQKEMYGSWKYQDLDYGRGVFGDETVFNPLAFYDFFAFEEEIDKTLLFFPERLDLRYAAEHCKQAIRDLLDNQFVVSDPLELDILNSALAAVIAICMKAYKEQYK